MSDGATPELFFAGEGTNDGPVGYKEEAVVTVGVIESAFLVVYAVDLALLLVIYSRKIPEMIAAKMVERALMRATFTSLLIPNFPVFSFICLTPPIKWLKLSITHWRCQT